MRFKPSVESIEPPAFDSVVFSALLRVIESSAHGLSGEAILRVALEKICTHTGWSIGHVWTPDDAGEALISRFGIWHLDEPERFGRFMETTKATRILRGEGLAGRAWETARAARTTDLAAEDATTQRDAHEILGIASSCALPVLFGDQVLHVIELFSLEQRELDDNVLAMMEHVGARLGEILELNKVEGLLGASDGGKERLDLAEPGGPIPIGHWIEQETAVGGSRGPSGWKVREAVVVTTRSGAGHDPIILFVSPSFVEMTGFREAEVVGRGLDVLAGSGTDMEALARIHDRMERAESGSEQVVVHRRDGSQFLMGWSITPMRNEEGELRHYVHIQTDVGRERRAKEVMRRAEVDALTGAWDRSVLFPQIQRCIERRHNRPDYQFAILFVDLDDFKNVNDTFGHLIGDDVLVAVARRLERSVRPGDTVARYGGDEFVILLDFVLGVEDVISVAERIHSEISLPFRFHGSEVTLAASMGIALSETGYTKPARMLEDADAAMYRAKQEGLGGYRIYDEELHREAMSILRMEADLLRSVRESAFLLHYQPLVALESGRIIGFEALLRWQHPDHGSLLPSHFLTLAEATGLIVSIGEWVFREACRQVKEWQVHFQPDPPLVLSVNVSAKELSDPEFVPRLEAILAETDMDPRQVQIEIDEEVITKDHEGLKEILRAIGELGVTTCIDDFGTGYSSLVNIHRHSLGTLKIDRALVEGVGTPIEGGPAGEEEMLRAILSLARSLGMQTIAEGVESRRQLDRLLEFGCEVGQGFFFSAPMISEDVEALLRRGLRLNVKGEADRPANDANHE